MFFIKQPHFQIGDKVFVVRSFWGIVNEKWQLTNYIEEKEIFGIRKLKDTVEYMTESYANYWHVNRFVFATKEEAEKYKKELDEGFNNK